MDRSASALGKVQGETSPGGTAEMQGISGDAPLIAWSHWPAESLQHPPNWLDKPRYSKPCGRSFSPRRRRLSSIPAATEVKTRNPPRMNSRISSIGFVGPDKFLSSKACPLRRSKRRNGWRTRYPQVNFLGPRTPDHAHDLPGWWCAAHDRVVDQHHALALKQTAHRIRSSASRQSHGRFAEALDAKVRPT